MIEQRARPNSACRVPASKIVLGLNCGGSDSFSGITANPALGFCSDLLAQSGGTAVLAETTEIFGAEHLLVRRARNRQVAEKLLGFVAGYKQYLNALRRQLRRQSIARQQRGRADQYPGEIAGRGGQGGHLAADGRGRLRRARHHAGLRLHEYAGLRPGFADRPRRRRRNLIAFTTGRGSAIGFPTIPVIKIASNSDTYRRMRDNMDVNAGRIADGEAPSTKWGARFSTCCCKSLRARNLRANGWDIRNLCRGGSGRYCRSNL